MKINYQILYCLAVATLFHTSCSTEADLPQSQKTDDSYLQFQFSISPSAKAYIEEETGKGTFQENDKIRLYSYFNNSNVHHHKDFTLTLQGNQWTPALTHEDLGIIQGYPNTILAFYPDKGTFQSPNKYLYTLPVDQSAKADFNTADLIGGTTSLFGYETEISLPLKHLMFRVNIDCSNLQGEIKKVQVRGKHKGFIQLNDGKAFADSESDFQWITPYPLSGSNGKRFAAILFPISHFEYQAEDLQVEVTLSKEGKEQHIQYKVPGSQLKELISGQSFTIQFYQKGEEPVDTEFANKQMWVYGITSPTAPNFENPGQGYPPYDPDNPNSVTYPTNQWFYYTRGIEEEEKDGFILWAPGCGWYDCNKTFNIDGADDSNMCWAGATSNMLHWWMEMNKDYIELYDKKYPHPAYLRPSSNFTNTQKSEIFNYLIQRFENRGSGTFEGIDWFITGRRGSNLPAIRPGMEQEVNNFHGFFPEVFGENNFIASYSSNMSKENFNRIIKDALKNHKAIGYDVTYNPGTHAMVIWGADFDEKGNVFRLYTCDNNNGELDPGPMCSIKYVIYKKSDDPYEEGEYTYIKKGFAGKPEYSNKVLTLHTLGLERATWEKVLGPLP